MTRSRFPSVSLLATSLVLGCGGTTFSSGTESDGGPSASGGKAAAGGSSNAGGRASGGVGAGGASMGGRFGSGGRLVGSGGTGSTVQLARDYDQSCEFDYECALVLEGDVCGCLFCQGAAIATTSTARWDADRNAIVCAGPPQPCPPISCEQTFAACAAGVCSARPPILIDETQYDRSCQSDSDCVVILTGDVCSVCRCQAGAINKSALPQYERDTSVTPCNPGPSPCDCAAPSTAHCALSPDPTSGTCVLEP